MAISAISSSLATFKVDDAEPYVSRTAETNYQLKSLCERIQNIVISTFFYIVEIFIYRAPAFIKYVICPSPGYFEIPTGAAVDYKWKADNQGLYVIVSGLNGHVTWADEYLCKITNEQPEMEVRVPYVHLQGQCSLDAAANPIIGMVRDYIKQFPGKPICLIGTSNGGRIVAKIETALRGEGAAIRVSAIAGVFFGSTLMDLCVKLSISSCLHDPAVSNDLQVGSQTSKDLIDAMREDIPDGDERDFEFFAATNDGTIPNFSSCLPIIGHGERHHVIEGRGHISIASAVRESIVDRAYLWMKQHGQSEQMDEALEA